MTQWLLLVVLLAAVALPAAGQPTIAVLTVPLEDAPCDTVYRRLAAQGGAAAGNASSCFEAYYVQWLGACLGMIGRRGEALGVSGSVRSICSAALCLAND